MPDEFLRLTMLFGNEAVEKLKNARAAVFGIGGVGGYAAEALARSGIGGIDIIDGDKVDITNINRQIIATQDTIGLDKVKVMKERLEKISPYIQVRAKKIFYLPQNAHEIKFDEYDYVIDAVDTVTAKLEIIQNAVAFGVPVISSMGTGNKIYPDLLEVDDIYNTSVCPLARVMRRELKKRGVNKLKVVYSKEEPYSHSGGRIPASAVFVPACAGMMLAAEAVRCIAGIK